MIGNIATIWIGDRRSDWRLEIGDKQCEVVALQRVWLGSGWGVVGEWLGSGCTTTCVVAQWTRLDMHYFLIYPSL